MEKLQNALRRARAERAQSGAGAPQRKTASSRPNPTADGIDTLWRDIEPVTLNRKTLHRNNVVSLVAGSDATPFDILRTKIFLNLRQNGWTRVAITSPDVACGKTTVFCNLAASFARQKETRAMMFEMDFRRPFAAKLLNVSPKQDLPSALRGDIPVSDTLLRVEDNVAMSLCNTSISDSAQLLIADSTSHFLDQVEQQYKPEIMVFDLPPMLVSDDTRAALRNVDCVLIIARSEHTHISRIDLCEREVAQHTNVMGIVLNDCRNISDSDAEFGEYY